jgi:hypothetical protein
VDPHRLASKWVSSDDKEQLAVSGKMTDDPVEDKIRAFQTHLTITLQSFAMRQDSEIFRIPRELRQLTVRDLRERWGGSLGGTVARMKREQIEAEERVRIEKEEEERKVKEKEAKGKRSVF